MDEGHPTSFGSPEHLLGSTPLLDLEDSRLLRRLGQVRAADRIAAPQSHPGACALWGGARGILARTHFHHCHYAAPGRRKLGWGDDGCVHGIHCNRQSIWNGADDSFLGADPTEQDPMVLQTLGSYHDPLQFVRSDLFRSMYRALGRLLHVNMLALGMRHPEECNRLLQALRLLAHLLGGRRQFFR